MAKKATVSRSSQQQRPIFQLHVVERVHDTDGKIQNDRKSIKKVIAPAPCIIVGADFYEFKEALAALFPYRIVHG